MASTLDSASGTDTLTPSERSERMGRVRSRDTKPEVIVRRLLHSLGYRYRLHDRRLPGAPDIVFSRRRKLVFVNGCFWHRHEGCSLARLPKSRLDFWAPKLESNRARDIENSSKLAEAGWGVLVVWECEIGDAEHLSTRLVTFLGGARCGL